jgi:hypothetical protein
MRTIWLGVIVVALSAAGNASAQESMMQRLFRPAKGPSNDWASQYTPTPTSWSQPQPSQPAAAIQAPTKSFLPAMPVVVPAAPVAGASSARPASAIVEAAPPAGSNALVPAAPPAEAVSGAILPASPPVMHEAVPSKGASVAATAKEKCDKVQFVLGRLKSWVAFRQLHGCCCDCAKCCHIPPLYLYTLHDCVGGRHAGELPCCAHETGPFRGIILCDQDSLAASRKHPVAAAPESHAAEHP